MKNIQLELLIEWYEESLQIGKSCKENVFVTLSTNVLRNQIVFKELKDSLGHVLLLLLFVKIMTISVNLFPLLDRSQMLRRALHLPLRNESGHKA